MRKKLAGKNVGNLHGIELVLDICNGRDRTVELDQRLGEIIGNLDILEPIERRYGELGNGDICEGIDFVDPVNSGLDSVIDGGDVVLDRCSEIAKSGLDEVGDL